MDTREKTRKTKLKMDAPQRRRKTEKKNPDVQVVYTQARPFNRNRFLLRLVTVVAIVLALIAGMSIFFKVNNVEVYGAVKYDSWQIKEASGIEQGDNLLTLNGAKICGRITTKLPYVKQARVELALPDTVKIEIVELDVAYAIQDDQNYWWLIDSTGKVIEQVTNAETINKTRILGVKLTSPEAGLQAVAVEPVPDETTEDGAMVPVTILGSERLNTAVSILQYLEENGILGTMASVDVSDMSDIQLWFGERYQIQLGDATQLSYKVKAMKQALDQSGEYQSGILDVSFTTWPDKVGYTPF